MPIVVDHALPTRVHRRFLLLVRALLGGRATLSFARGRNAEALGNFEMALRHYRRAAQRGVTDAAYRLGRFYTVGQGVLPALPEAIEWFEKAANQGHVRAQFELSLRYLVDSQQSGKLDAQHWFMSATSRNSAVARANRDILFPEGVAWLINPERALFWAKTAAEQGHIDAQANLGLMLFSGVGTEANIAAARDWLERAYNAGSSEAAYGLGRLSEDQRATDPTDAKAAARYYEIALERGYKGAAIALGLLYAEGRGVAYDPAKAAALYRIAAEDNNPWACFFLGLFCLLGEGVRQDTKTAETLLLTAARAGVIPAVLVIAECYRSGFLLAKNELEATNWCLFAAERGSAEAQFRLSHFYKEGRLLPRDPVLAEQWLRVAARLGHEAAQIGLAELIADDEATEEAGESLPRYLIEPDPTTDHRTARLRLSAIFLREARSRGSAEQSLRWIEPLARDGDTDAMVILADAWLSARTISPKPMVAFSLLRRASKLGAGKASFRLGVLHCEGKGVQRSLGKALRKFREAAEQGHPLAACTQAILMLEHQTEPEAQADAAAWLEWAAQGEVLEAAELLKKLIDRADPRGERDYGPPD